MGERARALGFEAVGIADPAAIARAGANLRAYVAQGRHGEMAWMESTLERRADPRALWPAAKSAVVVGLNYGPRGDPLAALARKDRGAISVYAQGADYHDVVKAKLRQLAAWIAAAGGCEVKLFVDTAPLMEKPLAEAAGIGWQGKHTNLVSRDWGSWLFLGVVLTTLELPAAERGQDHCGACRACIDACPTGAIDAPYRLDARRCVSYLTIERKGPIPRDLRPAIGNRIYGCDDCLAVCPWNKFAQAARELAFALRPEASAPRLADLAALDDAGFRAVFAKSPIKRIGRDRLLRNVLVAIGNAGDEALAEAARARLGDEAGVVRGAAVWALSRLWPRARLAALRGADSDPSVAAEWAAALADPAIDPAPPALAPPPRPRANPA
ncbi:MAG: tRNA epoxyqueuosine(34) reductase QueG [Alphaproteobacteria bacterium]|nr:tRNA epoxyqueuosine(34) reductase QueG [Alphaproteobacteria bacterium]